MSRLITTRYEYALYDDAQGVLSPPKDVPPTYPPTLDTYRVCCTAAVAQSFGVQNVSGPTGTASCLTPVNATVTVTCPLTNTTLVNVSVINGTPGIGLGVASLNFICGPGQTVTIPGSTNSGNIQLFAVNLSLTNVATPFSANLMWNL